MSSRQGQIIQWSSYNDPITLSAGSGSTAESVTLAYGPDHARWQQSYTGNGMSETTNYIGGLMDVVSSGSAVDYRHYIYAGSEPVAVFSRKNSGVNTLSYFLSDPQSTVAKIVNSSGGVVVSESFTPFGNRRNPATWSGSASNLDLTTAAGISRQAYTFQTQLGLWMGLNHMNGRVQDAITGRFLSADPIGTQDDSSQSFNRYSYVNNNPLTNIDPTGFFCITTYQEQDNWGPGPDGMINNNPTFIPHDYCFDPSPERSFEPNLSDPTPPTQTPSPQQPTPPQGPTWQQILCKGGNFMQVVAEKAITVGTTLEQTGAAVTVVGAIAGPEGGMAPGVAMMGTGAAATLGGSIAQTLGGTLQLFQTGFFNSAGKLSTGALNTLAGLESVALGLASFNGVRMFGTRGGNYVERALNEQLDGGFAAAGAAVDTALSYVPDMDPQEAECSEP
jgi:RHS repeat-associated protein